MVLSAGLTACGDEDANPIDPANPATTSTLIDLQGVTHTFAPTEEMIAAAEQQCREDPTLDTGYVRAVDQATEAVVSEYSVDCATVE